MSVAYPPRVKRPAATPHALPRPALPLDELFDLRRPPGYYAEAAKVALLRRIRTRPFDQLLVDFSGPEVFIELQAAGCTALVGDWRWQATIDGQALQAAGAWEELCWHTDADVDYLELELPLSTGWKLQRQMLLARKDEFLLLADALVGNDATTNSPSELPKIHYQSSLPLAPAARFEPAAESREGWLIEGKRKLAPVLPLALPEWRAEVCHASLAAPSTELTLSQAAQGRNLYAPLFLDLCRNRQRKPLTWRRLTVAEQLEIVPRDQAVGYRVQVGDWQWLLYRSLAPLGNRTLLGQNYASEFVACRFNRNGTTEDILEIK